MVFIAYGLNHKTAPLEVREKMAFTENRHDQFLSQIIRSKIACEAALLSTCNRTEIYCETPDPYRLMDWFADKHGIHTDVLAPYCYIHHDQEGLKHTLRVASGLDSMMLGEPQILGQMKQAYHQACRLGTIKSTLKPIFQHVFKASTRIRTLSGIGKNPLSVAYAAAQLIQQSFTQPEQLRVFLIGSGETARLVAKYLHQQGISQFFVASRTQENANKLAAPFNAKTVPINDIGEYLPGVDVVISATTCPIPFITKNLVKQTLAQRDHQPMFFLDLAVPRDIESSVADLPHVTLYNIDDLQNQIQQNLNHRQHAAIEAEQLINSELENYLQWHKLMSAKKSICDYRGSMQALAQQELARSMKQLNNNTDQRQVLEELCQRLIQKFTHIPTMRLKQAVLNGQDDLLTLIHHLYNEDGISEINYLEANLTHEEIA